MRTVATVAPLTLVVVLAGCDDPARPTSPAEPATITAPSLRAERVEVVNGFQMGGDPSNPLALQVAFDADLTAEDICAGNFTGDQNQGFGYAILTPSGGLLQHTSGRDVDLVLYQFGGGPVTGPCDLVGAPVLGTGTGKFTFPFLVTPGGAVVAHVTVQGIVDLISGGQARVLGTARVTVLPDGTLLFDEERINLTPL
jgi:hypothetical protein